MLQIKEINKTYGGTQELFAGASLVVNRGEKVGLIGRNGHGKSTLFRILLGEETIDGGEIVLPQNCSIGYLQQHLKFTKDSVLEETEEALPMLAEGYRETYRAEAVLMGLGFKESDFLRNPSEFSGGFQIRIQLAKLLVSESDILLLDEPTNYLDVVTIRWLENFLRSWDGTLMLITHDRRFMDKVVDHIAIIHRAKIKKCAGTTSEMYERIAEEEEIYQKTVENQRKRQAETMDFVRRFRAKASKARQVQSRVKALEKEGTLQELSDIEELDFSFPYSSFVGRQLMRVEDISFGYQPEHALFQNLTFGINPGDRIAIVGANGKGKSTLLEVLAGVRQPWSGNISQHAKCDVGYFGQTNISRLSPTATIEQEILSVMPEPSRTKARTICGTMMFSDDMALKRTEVLSGGEKARVLLGKLLAQPSNLLFLDEPLNHLDMYSVDSLIEAVEVYRGAVIFVVHDEDMIERLADRLIVFDGGRAFVWEGSYSDFLKRHGWTGEESDQPTQHETKNNSASQLTKKELRKLKAELQKVLNPLRKKQKDLEDLIVEHENSIEKLQSELSEITRSGYGNEAAKIARELSQKKEEIERLFSELEENEQARLRAEAQLES